jgi:hypothetical protein
MADLSHTIVFSAVSGAVKNALDGHPKWKVPRNFARSVAKRAAGTLAGMNPGVALAAARRSGKRHLVPTANAALGSVLPTGAKSKGRALTPSWAPALPLLKAMVEQQIKQAHKAGDQRRFFDLCYVSRILKEEMALAKAREAADA